MEKGGDHLNFLSSNTSLDWRFGSGYLSAQPTYMVPNQNANAVCKGNPLNTSPSSSISMVDSFSSTVWDHPSSQNLAFCTNNENQSSVSTSNVVASRNMGPGTSQSGAMEEVLNVGVGCNPLNSVSKGGFFLQTGIDVFPQNSTDVPNDSAFIERPARLSCFNNGSFSNLANLFSISESSYRGGIHMLEVPSGNGYSAVDGVQFQKNEAQMAEVVKDGMPVDHEVMESCLTKNEGETTGLLVFSDQGKDGLGASNNESDEAEFSGSIQEEQSVLENSVREPSVRTLGGKKRKRNTQFSQLKTELDQGKGSPQLSVENTKENIETKQKIEQNATVMGTKTTGKCSKDSYKNSDAPEEEYIHVRARRGQATNSHSLAERVRREKISERMKYLQDLVPGCSKVTSKAVMLDEIINYVQSLQQQVEFLSMKIAAVNPRLDLNIEALLSKDIFQSHAGTATHGVFPDMGMAHPQMHLLQQGLIQAGIPSIGNHSDFLRRFISSQLTAINGFKEPTPQINNSWNDELHNVVQMNFGINGPFNNQELNGSLPPGQMKVEL